MERNAYGALAATCVVASGLGCGGQIAGTSSGSSQGDVSTVTDLESGASVRRVYVGSTNVLDVGSAAVAATFDLLGGTDLELEVVTADASPLTFELWQAHVDGTATLVDPVDASSGFALDRIRPDEDARWLLVFPGTRPGTRALVRMDCVAGIHGCTPERQPGESCPAGWSCDEGLECALPVGACGPLAASGTCIVPPGDCGSDHSGAVCGCDGRTYASACAARAAWAPMLHAGKCG
jgi:hypothetical protein